ncbi:MAG: DUF177 domain-containing protein [Bacteroidales bacterium]|nr:DUF177 domain-containing protein [Bacteroidales bacterium]
MHNRLDAYSINFKGLSPGKHPFEFSLDHDFFAEFPEGEIQEGTLTANVLLTKQNNLMEIDCQIAGTVQVECDRCLEHFDLPTQYSGTLYVKQGRPQANADSDVLFIDEHEHQLNLAQYLYESVSLSLPIKRHHGSNGTDPTLCDTDMLGRMLQEGQQDAPPSTEADPRWDKLQDLKQSFTF